MNMSLPTRGAWIEISTIIERPQPIRSLPTRGAWIEIENGYSDKKTTGALPPRGEGIEIGTFRESYRRISTLPTRGAWIEIRYRGTLVGKVPVAPHTGSVD